MIPVWSHLFPFRTEKLNMPGPKIFKQVFEKIGRRRGKANKLLIIFQQKILKIKQKRTPSQIIDWLKVFQNTCKSVRFLDHTYLKKQM